MPLNTVCRRCRRLRRRRDVTRRPQQKLRWEGCCSGTRFVGTPRRSLRDVPSSPNGYAEDRDLSLGVTGIGLGRFRRQAPGSSIPIVKRNSPTVLNVAFNGIDESGRYDPANAPMFWDMRKRASNRRRSNRSSRLRKCRNTYRG